MNSPLKSYLGCSQCWTSVIFSIHSQIVGGWVLVLGGQSAWLCLLVFLSVVLLLVSEEALESGLTIDSASFSLKIENCLCSVVFLWCGQPHIFLCLFMIGYFQLCWKLGSAFTWWSASLPPDFWRGVLILAFFLCRNLCSYFMFILSKLLRISTSCNLHWLYFSSSVYLHQVLLSSSQTLWYRGFMAFSSCLLGLGGSHIDTEREKLAECPMGIELTGILGSEERMPVMGLLKCLFSPGSHSEPPFSSIC